MDIFTLLLTPLPLKLAEGPQKEETEIKRLYREDLKKKRPRKEEPTFIGPNKEFTLSTTLFFSEARHLWLIKL